MHDRHMASELHWLTISQTVNLLKSKELRASELFEHITKRIETLNPKLNAFVALDLERTCEHAKRIDKSIENGDEVGPLSGVLIAFKDICATAEFPTRLGSVALSRFLPGEDCEVADRIKRAGGVIVGKSTTTEAAFMEHHSSIEVPRNPWDNKSWTGVSSSGSGVATAAGLCGASFGTDTGGSIRFPALCCGLVGMKPTQGLVSLSGVFPLAPSMDHIGPMTRTVEDAAIILDVIADITFPSNGGLKSSFRQELGKPLEGLRLGFDEAYCTVGVAPLITTCIKNIVEYLREEGVEIVETSLPSSKEAVAQFPVIVSSEAAVAHSNTPKERFKDYSPGLQAALLAGRDFSAGDYVRANALRREFSGELNRSLNGVDAFIAPSWGRTTPTLAQYENSSDSELAGLIEFTAPQNLTGVPALCLPGGLDENGVPFGFQLFGSRWSDAQLLRLGAACERHTGFSSIHPDFDA